MDKKTTIRTVDSQIKFLYEVSSIIFSEDNVKFRKTPEFKCKLFKLKSWKYPERLKFAKEYVIDLRKEIAILRQKKDILMSNSINGYLFQFKKGLFIHNITTYNKFRALLVKFNVKNECFDNYGDFFEQSVMVVHRGKLISKPINSIDLREYRKFYKENIDIDNYETDKN